MGVLFLSFFFFQAEDGIRDHCVTGVQTCALPISRATTALRTLLLSLQSGALELPVAELVERVLERSGYLEALEAERTIEAQGRMENLQELVGVAREYQ